MEEKNTVTTVDASADASIDASEEKSSDEYSILRFCTRDTATLIAVVTGAVAVFSYAVKYLSVCLTNLTLSYWNVDSSLIRASDSIITLLGFSAISLALALFANALIIASFEKHKIISKFSACAKKLLPKKSLFRGRKKPESDNPETEFSVQNAYNSIKNLKKIESKELWPNLIIAFVLLFAAYMFLGGLMSAYSIEKEYVFLLILTLFSFLLALLIHYVNMKKTVSKELKGIDPYEELIALGKELPETEYPVQTLIRKGAKQFLKNSTFILTLLFFVITGIFMIVVFPFTSKLTLGQQKTFKTVIIDDVQYASVYSDSDIMVLEEADISEGEITIDLSKQRIVKTEGISFEIRKFDKVNRLKAPEAKRPVPAETDESDPASETTNTPPESSTATEEDTGKDEGNP